MQEDLAKWDFSNFYKSFDDESFKSTQNRIKALNDELKLMDFKADLSKYMKTYEQASNLIASLLSFVKCKGAIDNTNPNTSLFTSSLIDQKLSLENLAAGFFKYLQGLKTDDKLWQDQLFAPWFFKINKNKNSYLNKIDEEKKELFDEISKTSFYPLGENFTLLNKLMTKPGVARLNALLKGSGTKEQRAKAYDLSCEFYKNHASLYLNTLSALHGFNIARIKAAKTSLLQPALELNNISEQALDAMFTAIDAKLCKLQKSVSLRAAFINKNSLDKKLAISELNAPAVSLDPSVDKGQIDISYKEALNTIKSALHGLDPSLCDFVDFMNEGGFIDARVDAKKIGGAFCENVLVPAQQRVFLSYMNSFSSMSTLAHELGHAWHYHLLKDQPAVLCDVPMSLAESASTFNENLLRAHLLANSSDLQLRFDILWQELKTCSNFLLHIPARFRFELSFLKGLEHSMLSLDETFELMRQAWEHYFADTSAGYEQYLWCFKLHFYKTNQYLYNFPYTVGYLISQALFILKQELGERFFPAYVEFLKDSARLSVDDLIKKHLGYDISKPHFWELGIDRSLGFIQSFEAEFKAN